MPLQLDSITLPLAFAAGLVSFLSPCVLPLVPVYVAYLAGTNTPNAGDPGAGRRALLPGAAFVAGVSVVFIALFYLLAGLLAPTRTFLAPLAGVAIVLFGLHTARVLRIPGIDREFRPINSAPRRGGVLGGFALGFGLALGWTPCIGITLGAVLSWAVVRGPSPTGLALVVAYCLGLGLPFLLLGGAIGRAVSATRALARHRRAIDLTSGAVLVSMGVVLVLTGNLLLITQGLSHVMPRQLLDPFGL